jgi:hypothetical protein
MGILENATSALAGILDTHASVPISYSRGMTTITPLTAIRGSTPYESSDADGIIHRTIARDYLMAPPRSRFPTCLATATSSPTAAITISSTR